MSGAAPSRPTPYRVFVVEDHAYVRDQVADYLSEVGGFEVCGTAGSAAEALAALPDTACDLALIDVSMPGMNGIALVQQLGVTCPDVRCLMLSGHAMKAYAAEALRAGAYGYVVKGDPDALLEGIRAALRGERYVSPLSSSGHDGAAA